MSEKSVRVTSGSKQTAVKEALIRKAHKFLEEVKSEESKLISQIREQVKSVRLESKFIP